MPIPALDHHGLLPVGVHDCSWDEFKEAFCWNAHRMSLYASLQAFLEQEWLPLNLPAPLWLDGSFTRKKDFPEDIDVVADLTRFPNEIAWPGIVLSMKRAEWKQTYNVDFWIKHGLMPNDLTEYFQYAGLKASAELGIDAKHPKGILKVEP